MPNSTHSVHNAILDSIDKNLHLQRIQGVQETMKTSILTGFMLLVLCAGCSKDDSTSATVDQTLRAPTTITATRSGLTAVRINWTDDNETEEGYLIERQTGQGQFVQQLFTTRDVAIAVDSVGLLVNGTYAYRVRAIRYSERGDYSPVANIKLTLPYP